jgi:hypothetical protein
VQVRHQQEVGPLWLVAQVLPERPVRAVQQVRLQALEQILELLAHQVQEELDLL